MIETLSASLEKISVKHIEWAIEKNKAASRLCMKMVLIGIIQSNSLIGVTNTMLP